MRIPNSLDKTTSTTLTSDCGQPCYLDSVLPDGIIFEDEEQMLQEKAESEMFLEAVKSLKPPANFQVAKQKPKQSPNKNK